MSDQSKLGLGQIITTEQHRDAIHVAVAPVVAAHRTYPGDHVGINADGKADGRGGKATWIGVVDPFLPDGSTVQPDETFWLFLYPGTITSLRHEWAHPAFGEEKKSEAPIAGDKEESIAWLKAYAHEHSPYYENPERAYAELLAHAHRDEVFYYGRDMHSESECEDVDSLFYHLQIVLGKSLHRGNFSFSCSC